MYNRDYKQGKTVMQDASQTSINLPKTFLLSVDNASDIRSITQLSKSLLDAKHCKLLSVAYVNFVQIDAGHEIITVLLNEC